MTVFGLIAATRRSHVLLPQSPQVVSPSHPDESARGRDLNLTAPRVESAPW